MADIANVGSNNPGLNVEVKRIRMIEGRVYIEASAREMSIQPFYVDAEVRSFSEQQIMGVNSGSRAVHTSGRSDGSPRYAFGRRCVSLRLVPAIRPIPEQQNHDNQHGHQDQQKPDAIAHCVL
jgi:hypothetical protein